MVATAKFSQTAIERPEVADYKETGYEQCWYPVAQSKEIAPGKIVGQDFLDGRVIIYRDTAGQVHVMAAYCKHLGTDLSLAKVVGDAVRCPFHAWEYGPDGVCTKIPSLGSADEIPSRAKLFSYPVEENLDIIWVFNGVKPLYPVPTFTRSVDMSRMTFKVFEAQEKFRAEPWWIFTTNVFDFQHLSVLHGLGEMAFEIDVQDYSIGYAGGGITVWGVNCTLGISPQRTMVGGGTPLPGGGRKGYRVYAFDHGSGSKKEIAEAEAKIDELYEHETRIIVDDDVPIIDTLNYKAGGVLVPADRALATFLRYAQRYPRITTAELIAGAEHGNGRG